MIADWWAAALWWDRAEALWWGLWLWWVIYKLLGRKGHMAELGDLRAFIKKRQTEEGSLGTDTQEICLSPELADGLRELYRERDRAAVPMPAPARLGGGNGSEPNPAAAELETAISVKEAQVRAATVVVEFQALLSTKYQEILNEFDNPDAPDNLFFEKLAPACYRKTLSEGEPVDLPWSEIRPCLSFGEWDETMTKLFQLNRRQAKIPLSSLLSAKTKQPAETSTPVSG